MKYYLRLAGGMVASLVLVGTSAHAASFQDHMDSCIEKFANAHDSALVMLECTAADGKLSGCKVLDNSAGGKGFDKAALCVAEALPMGTKVGDIKVPIRFAGG